MGTSGNIRKSNLNEISMIPKHVKMMIINDSEALVYLTNSIINLFNSYKLLKDAKNYGKI